MIPKSLIEAKVAQAKADTKLHEETHKFMRDRKFAEPDTDMFWDITASLSKSLSFHFTDSGDAVGMACDHTIYDIMKGWTEDKAVKAAEFIAFYQDLKNKLSKACFDLRDLGRGDDGYGDLMDMLPLAGRGICEDLINHRRIACDEDLYERVVADHTEKMAKEILNGENYITSKLEEAWMDRFGPFARENKEDDE